MIILVQYNIEELTPEKQPTARPQGYLLSVSSLPSRKRLILDMVNESIDGIF